MTRFKGENPYIYGFHDKGGESLLIENGEAKGWVLITQTIGADANDRSGHDYSDLAKLGLGVIVRLNQDHGRNGTIPREARYADFAQRCANYVNASHGANIWLIGNEMNYEIEQPRLSDGSNDPEPITPRRYARCYKLVRQKIKSVPGHFDDLVVVGSIAPWNSQTAYPADPDGKYPANPTGDWIQYMQDILLAIGPGECDAIGIHAYSHGYDAKLVFSEARMNPPFQNRYYNFYTYREQMEAIPAAMRNLPVYLTEMNGDKEANGATWPSGNNGWIKNAYQEIDRWNKQGGQQIRCAILFRWMKDKLGWSIDGKPEVQKDLREAMQNNYQWNPDVTIPPAKPVTPPVQLGLTAEDISGSLPQHPTARYPMRTHTDIKRIIIHHSGIAPTISIQRIADYLVNTKNLAGITYHFCITDTGQVYQTQYLETVAMHAGANSADSVGVCLLGDFTDNAPPQAQLDATSVLLAQLAAHLGLNINHMFGRSEIENTSSPGATWINWKGPMLAKTQQLLSSGQPIGATTTTPPPSAGKPIEHYLLLWHHSAADWAVWDLMGAENYIAAFKPVIGFEVQQAKLAKYVTIVGGPGGVPGNAEQILQAAGCQVERISGASETETRQMLQQLARDGHRFKTLK
jgi:hypothetical protein